MIGYAMVGCTAVSGVPPQEKKGADTTKFVEVPLDVTFRYFFRAKKYAELQPYGQALRMLQSRDEAERELWVDYFRNGDATLGATIVRVFGMREAFPSLNIISEEREHKDDTMFIPQLERDKIRDEVNIVGGEIHADRITIWIDPLGRGELILEIIL